MPDAFGNFHRDSPLFLLLIKDFGKVKLKRIQEHEINLNRILTDELKDSVTIIGPENPELRGGIFNFYIGLNMQYKLIN